MPLLTTVIGSYPKPDYLPYVDWFQASHDKYTPDMYSDATTKVSVKELKELQEKAVKEVVQEQVDLGIDVITDGEVTRENYIFHFLRKLNGFDFENLTYKEYRNGACKTHVPTVCGPVSPGSGDPWCVAEWRRTQALTTTPVKMTIPGPMTIINTTYNGYYKDERELSIALVACINREVRALAEAGCKHIQIDEPLLVRDTGTALEYGIDHLSQCYKGVGTEAQKAIHLCCGYPHYLDQEGYPKADPQCYLQIADRLDNAGFDAVSIEDAHRYNDLALLNKFKKTTVIFGCVAIASSKVETEAQIHARVSEALRHIPPDRLILAPDCGLGFLPKQILQAKIKNMVAVACTLP